MSSISVPLSAPVAQPVQLPIEDCVTVQPTLKGVWFKDEKEVEEALESGNVAQVVESAMHDVSGCRSLFVAPAHSPEGGARLRKQIFS